MKQKACNSIRFFFLDIWRSLCGPIQRTVLPWGLYMTCGLAFKASRCKVNLTWWNKASWSPAHLDTGCYWPEVLPLARTSYWCGIHRILPPAFSVRQIPYFIVLEVYLTIRQPTCFEDIFVRSLTHSLGIKGNGKLTLYPVRHHFRYTARLSTSSLHWVISLTPQLL